MRPADREVVVGLGPTELVDLRRHELGGLEERRAVEDERLVERAVDAAFGRRAVVADDVVDERVVEDAEVVDRVDEPPDVVVGVREERRVHLHLAGEDGLELVGHVVPRRDLRGPRRELRVGGDHAERLLAGEDLLPERVPARVEATAVAVDPVLGHVVGRVRRARREVHEERPVGHQRLLLAHPRDGLVGHVLGEVVPLLRSLGRLERRRALVDRRVVLVRLTADEAVEVLEATATGRPRVERAHRARLVHRHLVALAELRGRVPVQLEDLRQRRGRVGTDPVVARRRRRELGDATHPDRMVIATGEQRLTRRRAQRSRVEPGVLQPSRGEPLRDRSVARPTERARRREADVVEQHDEHVRRARGRTQLLGRREARRRILRVVGDQPRIRLMRIRDGQVLPADRRFRCHVRLLLGGHACGAMVLRSASCSSREDSSSIAWTRDPRITTGWVTLRPRDAAGTCSAHPSGGEDTARRRAHDDRTASVVGEQYVSLLADEPRNEMS